MDANQPDTNKRCADGTCQHTCGDILPCSHIASDRPHVSADQAGLRGRAGNGEPVFSAFKLSQVANMRAELDTLHCAELLAMSS
jgi:hypothetical protein